MEEATKVLLPAKPGRLQDPEGVGEMKLKTLKGSSWWVEEEGGGQVEEKEEVKVMPAQLVSAPHPALRFVLAAPLSSALVESRS